MRHAHERLATNAQRHAPTGMAQSRRSGPWPAPTDASQRGSGLDRGALPFPMPRAPAGICNPGAHGTPYPPASSDRECVMNAYWYCLQGIVQREWLRFVLQRSRFFSALVRPLLWLLVFAAGFRGALRAPVFQGRGGVVVVGLRPGEGRLARAAAPPAAPPLPPRRQAAGDRP